MPDDEVWIEVDEEDQEVNLTISQLVELMGEEETRGFIEAQGMDPDSVLEYFDAENLSEIDEFGFAGQVRTQYEGPCFSSILLQTAVELSDQVEAYEQVPEEGGEWGYRMNWGLTIGSVTSSMSFLDATINEFIDDVSGSKLPFHAERAEEIEDSGFDEEFRQRLERLEKEVIEWRHMSTPQKYQTILIIADEEPFDPGVLPLQDVDAIRRLRNYFVHYKPEMYEYDQDEIQHRLGNELQGKFDTNPLAEDPEPYFPNKVLSHGCTEWCLETILEFTDDFFDRFELTPDYRRRDNFHFGDFV